MTVSRRWGVCGELIPEDNNPHDPKAVAVRIDGGTVGYMSRDIARSFRRRLGQKGLNSQVTKCRAIVLGGGSNHRGEPRMYGVKLDIKDFYN